MTVPTGDPVLGMMRRWTDPAYRVPDLVGWLIALMCVGVILRAVDADAEWRAEPGIAACRARGMYWDRPRFSTTVTCVPRVEGLVLPPEEP